MRCGAFLAALGALLVFDGAALGAEGGFDPGRPESWELATPDWYAVTAVGENVWAAGYWGAVLHSEDGGESWQRQPTPTQRTLFDVSFADARHGWAVGEDGTLLRTRDGGRSWSAQHVEVEDPFSGERHSLDLHLFGVSAVSPRVAWAVGDAGVVIRTRDGERWEEVRLPEEVFPDEEVPERIFNAVAFTSESEGWIAGEFGTVLRTRDGGGTWTGEREILGAPNDLYLFDLSALDAERAAVVGLAGNVLVSDDAGAHFEARGADTSAGLYGISFGHPVAVAVGDRGELFRRHDPGFQWARGERPRLFNWLRDVAAAGEGRFFAVGEKGLVLRSQDGGATWAQLYGQEPPPFGGVSVPERHGRPGAAPQAGPKVPLLPGTGPRSRP
jgi:photosystem II stability/assembly factor-like uncharacterized protein